MSRLQSAARDYAIAVLSSRTDAAHALAVAARVSGPGYVAAEVADWMTGPHPRLVRARLALYLRLLRRCEAWERLNAVRVPLPPHEWPIREAVMRDLAWAEPPGGHVAGWWDPEGPLPRFCWVWDAWSPLWLSAPAHSADITPAARRATMKTPRDA